MEKSQKKPIDMYSDRGMKLSAMHILLHEAQKPENVEKYKLPYLHRKANRKDFVIEGRIQDDDFLGTFKRILRCLKDTNPHINTNTYKCYPVNDYIWISISSKGKNGNSGSWMLPDSMFQSNAQPQDDYPGDVEYYDYEDEQDRPPVGSSEWAGGASDEEKSEWLRQEAQAAQMERPFESRVPTFGQFIKESLLFFRG